MNDTQIFSKVLEQVISLFLLAIPGFWCARKGIVAKGAGVYLASVVIKITSPILVLFTLAGYSFTPDLLKKGLIIYILSFSFILLAYFISVFECRFFDLSTDRKNLIKMSSMFGNSIFIAFPLLFVIFGNEGIIYGIFYNLAWHSLLWTFGINIINKGDKLSLKEKMNELLNINSISFILGISIAVFKYFFGNIFSSIDLVERALQIISNSYLELGKTTIYLSMVFIGLILAEVKFKGIKDIFKRKQIFIYSITKLIIMPCIAILFFYIFGSSFDPMVKHIVIIQTAMPCATTIVALAAEYKSDYAFASECVFFTTLLALITLPLVAQISFLI